MKSRTYSSSCRTRGSWVGAAEVLAALPGYGFAGLAAVMAVVGQFALALVFGVIACGVFVRLWRARRHPIKHIFSPASLRSPNRTQSA